MTTIPPAPPLFRVYVDEVGDRGTKPTSSPFFSFAALVVRDGPNDQAMMAAHDQACIDLQKPTGTALHWRDNLKYHHQRRYAAELLGSLKCRLVYVVVEKARCSRSSYIMSNTEAMYLWPARLLLERVSWLVDEAPGGAGKAIVTFGEVKGFKAETLARYVRELRDSQTDIRWQAIQNVRMRPAAASKGVQFADIAAGALDQAIRPQLGGVEPAYLAALRPVIYQRPPGPLTSYGLKAVPSDEVLTSLAWWPDFLDGMP